VQYRQISPWQLIQCLVKAEGKYSKLASVVNDTTLQGQDLKSVIFWPGYTWEKVSSYGLELNGT